MVDDEAGMASRIEAAQVGMFFSRARSIYLIHVVNAAVVVAFLSGEVASGRLVAWLLIIFAVTAVRYRFVLGYERDAARDAHSAHWRRMAVRGAAAAGVAWGLAALVLFPPSVLHQMVLVVALIAMMASSVASWHACFLAFQAYFLPVALALFGRFALGAVAEGGHHTMFASLGAVFLAFSVGLYRLAYKSNLLLNQMLAARYEKEATEDRYRALFHGAKTPMMLIDPETGSIVDCNDAAGEYYGYPAARLREMNIVDINTLSREEIVRKMSRADSKRESRFEFRHRLASGEVRDVEVHSGPVELAGRRLLFSIVHDITERRRAEESMRLAALVFRASSEGIMVLDGEGRIVRVNPAFSQIIGYTPEEVVGLSPASLMAGADGRAVHDEALKTAAASGHWEGEGTVRCKDGGICVLWGSIGAIPHADGGVYSYVAQFFDITEKKHKDEQVWWQANYDMLTGLPNRRLFRDRLEREIVKSNRTGQPLALMFIDLDYFKKVNDTMGHDMGDRLLTEAAQRILKCVRESDTVARLGGDEFTVILSDFGSRDRLARIAQDIIARLRQPFALASGEASISASIGLTIYPDDARDMESLLKTADRAMYEAKGRGRNGFVYFADDSGALEA